MIGRTVSRYRITAKLREGVTGSVWRAEDTLLGRTVDLRLLSPQLGSSAEAREQFFQEAHAASRLAHPGIAALRDMGEVDSHLFIAFQSIDGETLARRLERGPLELPELRLLASVTADALAHAHAHGRLHGGLTSSSIVLRPDGSPAITDFGFERTMGTAMAVQTSGSVERAHWTAPELWRGEQTSVASDLWSLGVVLYHAATGRLPFMADSWDAMKQRILQDEPPRPSRLRAELPAALDRVIMQLLRKDPHNRPTSASEVATITQRMAEGEGVALASPGRGLESPLTRIRRWWRKLSRRRFGPVEVVGFLAPTVLITGAGTLAVRGLSQAHERVLAVLPMRIAGSDSTEAAVASEALGEELVGRLRGAGGFRVLPWVTTGRPFTPDTSLVKVASGLHATVLLTGTITGGDEQTGVRLALVDGRSGVSRWTRELTAPAGDFAALQDRVALSVAEGVIRRSNPAFRARIAADAPRNPEANAFFIRGASAWHSGDPDRMRTARLFYEQALELDSTLSAAWVALGATHIDAVLHGAEGDSARFTAERCFERALRLRPGLPVAERALSSLAYENPGKGTSSRMLQIAARALQRDPNDVDQLTTAAWGFALSPLPDLAIPVLEHALKLDPANQGLAWYRVLALGLSGRPSRCIAAGADYVRHFGEDEEVLTKMGASARTLGRFGEALTYLERANRLTGGRQWYYSKNGLVRTYLAMGDTAHARTMARQVAAELRARIEANPTNQWLVVGLAAAYELAGDTTRLLDQLESIRRLMTGLSSDSGTGEELDLMRREALLVEIYARSGRLDEARELLRRISPENEQAWPTVRDSMPASSTPRDPRIEALTRSPEYVALQAAQRAHVQALFDRYQPVVTAALPSEPNVPKAGSR